MEHTTKTTTVHFSAKGQVVIPHWLRKEFEIEEGTPASVVPTPRGILITPLTAKHIRGLRGSLKGSKAMELLLSERKKERES
ncbi:MAG: AbrB/MazE/SpoVT family DNA-binding domain-containing protein [Candidatus Sumerlaeota bacterium]|nr:AbrB/MazE/SpoVT family DNA-binding domain-containing protein [Candidatus Sumerlaeota bacterium]